ncbi:MAG: hypothetical protein KKF27_21890 [Gammaproteobacteria bacterium]|nr:hypothetical protein [Gammaproteobacteria bacterium]MBU2685903.1 hypothetical protein [Gammaproteobacteria bacterium]
MKKSNQFTIAGQQVEARNKTEAQETVLEDLACAESEGWSPFTVSAVGYPEYGIVFRQALTQWGYITVDGKHQDKPLFCGCTHCIGSKEDAERSCRLHLAQIGYDSDDPLKTGEEFILNEANRKQHASWVNWQNRYKHFRSLGHTDSASHIMASGYTYK